MTGLASAVGQVVPYRPPKARDEATAWLGMVLFLASWAMMFAALFMAYAFVRIRSKSWPPGGLPELPMLLPAVNTVAIALSSAVMQGGIWAVRRGRGKWLGPALLGTVLLGGGFVALQFQLWEQLREMGLTPAAGGPYTSVVYGLSWVHAAHVGVGLLGIACLMPKAFSGEYNAARHLPVRLWAMYWHFVGIVWALMFVALFVL